MIFIGLLLIKRVIRTFSGWKQKKVKNIWKVLMNVDVLIRKRVSYFSRSS